MRTQDRRSKIEDLHGRQLPLALFFLRALILPLGGCNLIGAAADKTLVR